MNQISMNQVCKDFDLLNLFHDEEITSMNAATCAEYCMAVAMNAVQDGEVIILNDSDMEFIDGWSHETGDYPRLQNIFTKCRIYQRLSLEAREKIAAMVFVTPARFHKDRHDSYRKQFGVAA